MPVTAHSVTGFGLRLLEQLGPGPVTVSPLSVHRALATFRQGASGETREALDAVLGDDAEPKGPVPLGWAESKGTGPLGWAVEDPAIRLELAQALWLDPAYRLDPAFAEAAALRGVDCRTLDFGDPGAPGEVNAWAAEHTDGMIDHVVSSFEADEVMALADAAYFEGSWTVPFRPALTEPRPFTRPDGGTVEVPTMHRGGDMDFYEDEAVQAVRLPYGNELELAFVAVIARDGLEAPAPDLATWRAISDGLHDRPGRLALPRLRLASNLRLEPPLTALGLGPMFQTGGDLDGMFTGPGPAKGAGRVLHDTRVDLDEEGTRAAAVTVVTARAVSAPLDPPEPFDLRLDRPFLWAIEHRESGTLLFLGRVADPSTT